MKKSKKLFSALAVLAVCSLLYGSPNNNSEFQEPPGRANRGQTSPSIDNPVVINKTHSLNIVHWELLTNRKTFRLIVTNTSSETITEFVTTLDRVDVRNRFWGLAHEPLRPGETATLDYDFLNLPRQVSIEAVLFENGTGDGDRNRLKHSLSFQIGFHEELHRVTELLSNLLKTGELSLPQDQLLQRIANLRQDLERPAIDADRKPLSDDELWIESGHKAAAVLGPLYLKTVEDGIRRSNPDPVVNHGAFRLKAVSDILDRLVTVEKRLSRQLARNDR